MVAPRGPTRRQLGVLRAFIAAGSIKLAAYRLDLSESTARQHLAALYRRTGCQNAVQAVYLLGATEGRAASPHAPSDEAADRASLGQTPGRGTRTHR